MPLLLIAPSLICYSQSNGFRYFRDDAGQLVKVIDASGNEVDYTYDAVGNIVSITRGASPPSGALAILSFTPQSGAAGAVVTIQGQNFSTTPASNSVGFNGAAATVLSATATTLTASVPTNATTGPISVTVAGQSTKSTTDFTFIAGPIISAITPKYLVSSSSASTVNNFQVTGTGLSGATFSFLPAFNPAVIAVNSATINPAGTSATLSLTVAANALGSFSLMASNGSAASSQTASPGNTVQIITPDGDADGDGLTNAVEIAIGTDPFTPDTSGDGLPDGWQVFFGLNPLEPSVAGEDLDNSGLTVLQDFQQGLSPINPNRVPPAVSEITPANNATIVNINGVVVVRFTEPLLTGTTLTAAQSAITAALGKNTTVPSSSQQVAGQTLEAYMNRTCCGNSVIPGTVTLTGPDGAVSGSVTSSSDSLSVTFAPAQTLASNTLFNVQVNGVRDAAGNLMTTPFTSSFTTGTAIDFTQPTLVLVDPENGIAGVPTNAHYTVQFSKAINPATLTPTNLAMVDSTTGQPIPGMVQADSDGFTAAFIPNSPLPAGQRFVVSLSTAIQDTFGNNLVAAGPFAFTTADTPETAPPHLVANSPTSNAANVGTNALINLEFSEPLDIATVVPNIEVSAGGQPIAVMVALSNADKRVTVSPAAALMPGAQYTVTIGGGIADLAGLTLDNAGSFTFQTGNITDPTGPSVISVDPANGATGVPLNTLARLAFSKPVDPTSLLSGTIVLYADGLSGADAIPGSLSIAANGDSVAFTPAAPLTPETAYCFYINGIVDVEGHGLAQNNYNISCFTTGVSAAGAGPAVVSMSPASGSASVPLNAQIALTFSSPISTVAAASGITVSASGIAVPGTVSVSNTATTATFTPTSPLAGNTEYTVQAGGITDLAGNAAASFSGVFTTTASPTLIVLSTGLDAAGNLITTGGVEDAHWVVTPTATTPPAGTFSVSGTPQPLLVAAPGDTGFFGSWLADGPNSSWVAIDPNSVTGNTFGVYSTTFDVPGTTVPANLCLVGAMGVDDNGQLGLNGTALMPVVSAEGSLYPLNIAVSNLLVPGKNTLSLGWGPTDNYYEGFRLQAAIESCGASITNSNLTVTSISPVNGTSGVSVTSPVVVTFSSGVDGLTVNDLSLNVEANGATVAGSYVVSGPAVTFTPLSAYPAGSTVAVYVDRYAAVTDLAGNAGQPASASFTTASTVDATPPAVVSVTPSNGATGIGSNGQVTITFSKSMNSATLTACCTTGAYTNVMLLAGETRLGFTPSISADNRTLTLTNLGLPSSTAITVVVTHGAEDLSGNALPDFTSQFTTGAGIETGHGTVLGQRPANGATGVGVNLSPIVLFTSVALNPSAVQGAVHVAQNGQPVGGTVALDGNGQTATFTPSAPWAYGALIEVFLDATATDVSGNTLTAYQGSFNTVSDPASTAPALIAVSPLNGAVGVPQNAVIDAGYSQPLSASTVIPANVTLTASATGTAAPAALTLDPTGTIVHIAPAVALGASTRYCFALQHLTGSNGLAVTNATSCFTTGTATVTTGPAVVAVSPASQLSGVPLNARVSVLFSAPVDSLTVNATTIALSGGGGQTAMPASISFSNNNQTVEIAPQAPLPASAAMTLAINGVTDLAGNPVTAQTTHFTTGTLPALSTPGIVNVNPSAGQSGAPTNAALSLQASGALDATTLNSVTFYPQDDTLTEEVAGSYSLSADATTAYFVPSAALATGRQYSVFFANRGLTDLAGNTIQACCGYLNNYSFTTGFATSSSGPAVTGASPLKGQTQTPTNVKVVVVFNEPVDAESLGQITLGSTSGPVAFTAALSAGNQTLTLTPAAELAQTTTYTLTVTGVTDLSGNAMSASFTSTFTTGLDPDFTQFSVTAFDPGNGLTGVPLNALVSLRFSKPVDQAAVRTGNVEIYPQSVGGAGLVGGQITIAPDGLSLTMTPPAALTAETVYCVYTTGLLDQEGDAPAQNNQTLGCFTTGAAAAATAPTVTAVSPANGATGVAVNAQIQITLSAPVSTVSVGQNAIALTAGSTPVPGTVAVTNSTTLSFTPSAPLTASTTYSINAANFSDLAGNAISPFNSDFTTGTTSGQLEQELPRIPAEVALAFVALDPSDDYDAGDESMKPGSALFVSPASWKASGKN